MAQSPPRAKTSPYSVLNDGLDHALQLLENEEDLPTGLKLRPGGREKKTPCAMWKEINVVAKARWHHCIRQERRRKKREQAATAEKSRAKEKEKEKNKSTTPRNGERKKDEPLTISVTKTNNKQLQTEQESKTSRRKSRNEPPTPPTPNVKMLDLSGSNLSPVITHTRPTRKQQTAMDGLKPLAPTIADSNADLLTKLQRLPMLEDVVAGSEKLKLLKQWLAKDDGKNENLSLSLKELILELQKNQHLFNPINDNDTPSSSPRDLDETLDERMKKEKAHKKEERREKLRRIKAKEKVALKPSTQSPREKLCTDKAEKELKSRKRPLVVFVVDSDEEEYEEEGESESEEEYEGDDDEEESEDDAGVEFGDADDDDEDRREVGNDSKSLPASSPKSPSAKEQLAVVTARIRKDESQQRSSSTYLSYGKTTSKPTETKSGASATRPSITPPTPRDGSSVSSAIVLEDSDDEDDDEETEIVVAAPSLPPPPPPTPPKVKKAERPRATPPTPPKPTKAATSNGKGKAKATPPAPSKKNTSGKRRAKVDSDDESEAEFQGPDEDGSSTDAEPDLFDLNEQDVYVVETILEVKVGRSLLNNSGRRTKEADLFLVKWDGYEELTWEPEDNIPNRLIQFFHDREAAKRACQYQVEKFMHRKVSLNSTTGKREILYLILWKGQSQPYWEVKSNLPEKVVIWLEKTSRASLPKSPPANGPGPRKKAKN